MLETSYQTSALDFCLSVWLVGVFWSSNPLEKINQLLLILLLVFEPAMFTI